MHELAIYSPSDYDDKKRPTRAPALEGETTKEYSNTLGQYSVSRAEVLLWWVVVYE